MNACDLTVVDFLASHAGFSDHQIQHLSKWWQACRNGDEELARFLQRQDLLSEPTVQIFRQIGMQNMSIALGRMLVDRSELESLRRRLPEVAVLENAGLPATVTLLAGDDTAKDLPAVVASPAEPLRVGGMLGKYLLTDWAGEGAAGVVYRAFHPTLHIPVAVKVLHPVQGDGGGASRHRLVSEARLLAKLNHPNIVRVFDFEQEGPYAFVVLECVNGPTLAELIEQCGRIQPDRAVRLARQLAAALAGAHRLGIVHRDVKPANVLLTRDGTVKLADLGLATVSKTHSTGDRVGTVRYLAPELAGSNRSADEQSDMYSFGATLFHALTGSPPFTGDTAWELIAQHVKTPPPSPRQLVPEIPSSLADLVVRMLAKQPDDRPAGFAELLADPGLCGTGPEMEFRPHGVLSRLWRRMLRNV